VTNIDGCWLLPGVPGGNGQNPKACGSESWWVLFLTDMVCCKQNIYRRYGAMDDQQHTWTYETIKAAVAGEK